MCTQLLLLVLLPLVLIRLDGYVAGAAAASAGVSRANNYDNGSSQHQWNVSSSTTKLHFAARRTQSGKSAKLSPHDKFNKQLLLLDDDAQVEEEEEEAAKVEEVSVPETKHKLTKSKGHNELAERPNFNAIHSKFRHAEHHPHWAGAAATFDTFDEFAAEALSGKEVGPSEPLWSSNGAIIQSGGRRYRRQQQQQPNRHRHQHNYRRFIGDTWPAALVTNTNHIMPFIESDHSPAMEPRIASSNGEGEASASSSAAEDDGSDVPLHWPVKKVALMEGDLVLGGLMMVHSREDTMMCGPIMPQGGVQVLEAMLYTLDRINRDGLLPDITIGAHILDDCDRDSYGLEMAVDFIKGMFGVYFCEQKSICKNRGKQKSVSF